ncbi:probable glutamate receptor [Neodiprion pinetum]|uniref:probable glutamate receptor n=1 Tax=Neodiprion pinetum TaxID=441929 RepID=UPI00371EA29D
MAVQVTTGSVEFQQNTYPQLGEEEFFHQPKNLASNFKRRNYANIQIDVFLGSKTADYRLVDLIVKDCSVENVLTVSGWSKVKERETAVEPSTKLQNLILIYDSASRIDLEIVKRVFERRWNSRAQVMIFVEVLGDKTLLQILGYFWSRDLLNVVLSVLGIGESYTYNPFLPGSSPGSRGAVAKLRVGDPLFPDKLTDLHNHSIPVSVFFHFPKAVLWNFTRLKNGADIEVQRALSRKLNFTADLKTTNIYGISHVVRLPDGEHVGMMGDVLVNRSDIVFNAQNMESTRGRHLETTYPTLQTGSCVLVPKAKMMPMIVRMVRPFSKAVWTAEAGVVVMLLVCLTLAGEENKLIKVLRLLLHYAFAKIPRRLSTRVFCISCVVWAYVMACMYQVNFMKELIIPRYYRSIETLEDLDESGLPLLVGGGIVQVLNNSEVPVFRSLAKRTIEFLKMNDCIQQLIEYSNVSCGVDEYVGVLLSKVRRNRHGALAIHKAKERLSLHWDVYVAKEGFPYLEKFNLHIQSLVEAGLYRKWLQDVLTETRMGEEEARSAVLILKHYEGVFILLFLGLALSTAVFILEVIAARMTLRKIPITFRRIRGAN